MGPWPDPAALHRTLVARLLSVAYRLKLVARLVLGLGLASATLTACIPVEMRGERATVAPSYVFALGTHQNDIEAMLGFPSEGPRFDRLTQTIESVYVYPFQAIQAETQFPNGTTRAEMVDRIHMFFSRDGVLLRMSSQVDRWYSTFTALPVQRITVLPRLIHADGRITEPKSGRN